MGISETTGEPLAEALFSSVQRRVLAMLFGRPERTFQSAEVIRLARGGTGAVHRELRRLEEAGWLTVKRIGNQKHYQANRACPAFRELHGLVAKTLGTPAALPRERAESPRRGPGAPPGPRVARVRAPEPEPEPAPAPPPNDGWKVW